MGRKLTKPAAFLAIVLLAWLFSPAESTLAGEKCKAIKANQTAAINATGTGTTGTVTNNGLLKGTTQFTFTSPLTPVANAPGTFSYTGVLTLTTDKGTLTTGDVGIFDV